jgi:hypothetical protein
VGVEPAEKRQTNNLAEHSWQTQQSKAMVDNELISEINLGLAVRPPRGRLPTDRAGKQIVHMVDNRGICQKVLPNPNRT